MRWFWFCLVVLVFSGCLHQRDLRKQRKAQRKIEQYKVDFPQLFSSDTSLVIKRDTIVFVRDSITIDTLVGFSDTIRVVKNNVITEVLSIRDTITQKVTDVRIKTIVLPDTAYIESIDTFYSIREEIVTKTEYKKYVPKWVWLLIGGLCGFVFWLLIRRNGKATDTEV